VQSPAFFTPKETSKAYCFASLIENEWYYWKQGRGQRKPFLESE